MNSQINRNFTERVSIQNVLDFMHNLLDCHGLIYDGGLKNLPFFAEQCHSKLNHDCIEEAACKGSNDDEEKDLAWSEAKDQLREMGVIDSDQDVEREHP